jgi:hypothetical protein
LVVFGIRVVAKLIALFAAAVGPFVTAFERAKATHSVKVEMLALSFGIVITHNAGNYTLYFIA